MSSRYRTTCDEATDIMAKRRNKIPIKSSQNPNNYVTLFNNTIRVKRDWYRKDHDFLSSSIINRRLLDPISFLLSHEQIWIFFPNVMFLFAETRGMSKARLVEQEPVFFRFETRI